MIDLIVQAFRCESIKTPTHLLVVLALARRCGDEDGVCFATQATLSKDTRLHVKTVSKVLSDLAGENMIERVKHDALPDGRRISDHIYLTLPAVTLPKTGRKQDSRPSSKKPRSPELPGDESHGVDDPKATESSTPKPPRTGLPNKRPDEETNEETHARDARELSEEDIDLARDAIWFAVGDLGRKRSSKAKVRNALAAALNRRPKGQPQMVRLELIMRGVNAYLQDPDTRKENGKFEHGAHRTLEGDVWETYLMNGAAAPAPTVSGPVEPVDPNIGTNDRPGPALQALWAERAQQGLGWDVTVQGPRPGMPGCRLDDAVQRAHGFEPYAERLSGPSPDLVIIDEVKPAAVGEDGSAW